MKPYYETTLERSEDFFEPPRLLLPLRPRRHQRHAGLAAGAILFGRFMHSNQFLRLAEKLAWARGSGRRDVTVDVFVPFSRFPEFMEWYWRELGSFPLWCVPYRPAQPLRHGSPTSGTPA